MRLIDADALKEQLEPFRYSICGFEGVLALIDNAPTVETEQKERPQGEWKLDSIGAYCSECKTHPDYTTNYCGNCGAQMKGNARDGL